MPTSDALMGLGMPAQQAAQLGANPNLLTCAGTTAATAATIKSRNTELSTAGGATACVPPASAPLFEDYHFFNSAATTAILCVPVGHTLNGALNGTLNLLQNKACIMWQYKPKFWCTNLTA